MTFIGVLQAAVCHAQLLHGHVVQLPPIRAENVLNDITMDIVLVFIYITPLGN